LSRTAKNMWVYKGPNIMATSAFSVPDENQATFNLTR
jgi:hypothetical protein